MLYNKDMDAVEDIKQRLNIEDVIGEYVELKRAGRNFKGMSPFTSEKTASFMVSPEKQIWHDFSSNKGGTMFTFVMEMEGVDFKGSIDILARKAGLDMSLYQRGGDGKVAKRKERALQLLEMAATYYQHVLLKNETALKYLRQTRGYTKETITGFRFGYAPDGGRALGDYLIKKGFTVDEMFDGGVIAQRRGGLGDMFRGRITLPLMNGQGQVVGFTARILRDEPNAPKYINTPSTLIYDKGRQLYGLSRAKQAIRTNGFAVVVEGNLDVVASHQAGVENVVAVAGTALTLDHLKSLSRLTDDVRFAFDQDRAGVAATERAIPIAQGLGLKLSIIDVPSGKDPDELIKQDPQLWRNVTEKSLYVMDWLIQYYTGQFDLSSAQGKSGYSNVILAAIQRLQDPVEQEHYLLQLSEQLGVSIDSVRRKFASVGKPEKPVRKKSVRVTPVERTEELEKSILLDRVLALCMVTPALRERLDAAIFKQEQQQKLATIMLGHTGKRETMVREDLHEVEDYAKIVTFKGEELYGALDFVARDEELTALLRHLKADKKQQKLQILHQEIAKAEAENDSEALSRLLAEYNQRLREE